MGKRVTFEVTASSRATPGAVYELLRAGATWPTWSPIDSFRLDRPNADGVEGVGAVRVFRTSFISSYEEIVEMAPDKGISYVAFAGLPMRDHRADVEIVARDGGTAITWRETFTAKVPGTGWMLRAMLYGFVEKCARGLATHAEEVTMPTIQEKVTTPDM